ncbi:MAG: hypothetical protein FWF31_02455 [Desulfobulbus sp.]|nr:hypothetical protein [Desulfobulbus sp.]
MYHFPFLMQKYAYFFIKIQHVACWGRLQRQEETTSGRGDQDGGGGWRVQTDGAAVDFDHTAPAAPLAEQFQLGPGKNPQHRHAGTGLTVARDGANPHAAVAARFGQGRRRSLRPFSAPFAPPAQPLDIAEEAAGNFGLFLVHARAKQIPVKIDQAARVPVAHSTGKFHETMMFGE